MALKKMYSRLAATAAAAMLTLSAANAAAAPKIGVIDWERAIARSNEGLKATTELDADFKKRQDELNTKQQDLITKRTKLTKRCQGPKPTAKCMRDAQKLQRDLGTLQMLVQKYNEEHGKKRAALMAPIIERMRKIVRRVAQKKGYAMVVNRQALPYSRKDLDVTDLAIRLHNEDSKVPPPKPKKKKGKGRKRKGRLGHGKEFTNRRHWRSHRSRAG